MKQPGAVLKYLAVFVLLVLAATFAFSSWLSSTRRYESARWPVPAAPIAVLIKTYPTPSSAEEMYLDLLKRTLTRTQTTNRYIRHTLRIEDSKTRYFLSALSHLLGPRYEIVERAPANPVGYYEGGGIHLEAREEDAETMVGTRQLDNIQFCMTDVLKHHVPGDVIECGAWRGGLTIFMRGVLRAYGDTEKTVWVADSFEGLPRINYLPDLGWGPPGEMSASVEEVQENFARYGMLDKRVRFLKGFFNKTLPGAPISKLSILRADADLYESQRDVLSYLYPKLSIGGYMIVDDYPAPGCKRAIDDYRKAHDISEEIKTIDTSAIYWQKLH